MKKPIISILIVIALVCVNFFGIFMFGSQEDLTVSPHDITMDEEEHDIASEQNQLIDSSSEPERSKMVPDLAWHLLPQDSNPSAKLFLEQQAIGIEFRLPDMRIEQTEEGEIIHLDGYEALLDPGKPLVPECKFFVAVPPDSQVTNVHIEEVEIRELTGNHMLAPYVPQTVDGLIEPVYPDPAVYSSENPFPSSVFEINGPDKLRHLDAIEVVLYPVRVKPASGILEVFDLLRLRIELETKSETEMTSPFVFVDDNLDRTLLETIVNPDDVSFYTSEETFSRSYNTRAPSTIYQTLGYKEPADLVHPTNDTTVGNVDGVALLQEDDEDYYTAEAGTTMYVDGFDIGLADPSAALEYAVLHLQYVGTDNYNGDSNVRWALQGQALQDTTIEPGDLNEAESDDETYNLLGHAGSPTTVSDLIDLDVEFTENGAGGGSKDIPFDYIFIEFVYRQEMTEESDYVIITDLKNVDELTILAEWKTQGLGINTQVYDSDWINANWDGSNLKERIHNFITSMYENYSIEWVLLCGNNVVIPTDSSSYDNYYANVDGFNYPDISLGRLPSSKEDEMEGMVEDIMANQRDLRPWKNNMYLVGTNVFGTGDGRSHMLSIKDNYLVEQGLTFYEDYEVEGNNSNQRTIDHYNLGMGTSAYYGHGSSSVWTRNNGSTTLIRKSDVTDDFNNSEKRGFVWTLSCSTAKYLGSSTSIGETWVIARNGGGIGYIGGAELVYVSPGMGLHRAFWGQYEIMRDNHKMPTQGEVHFRAQNQRYYRIYVLYGDPQVGISLADPNLEVLTGRFDAVQFVEQKGFDQEEEMTFETTVRFPPYVLPEGVHFNMTVTNESGAVFYPDELYDEYPGSREQTIFWNWTVPSEAGAGVYNITIRIYNTSQDWEFNYENITYLFVDYNASLIWIEQFNPEVIEGDTVTYRIHIDNYNEPIPDGRICVYLDGRDYYPYLTPFDYDGINITDIPSELDYIVEIEIPVLQPGTYNVSAELYIDWAIMDSAVADNTGVRGIRILDITLNHPLYFRGDTANMSYHYFAYTDFTGNASFYVEDQSDQLYEPFDFYNGTNWLNFTWIVPLTLPNSTYDIDMEINGLGRSLETDSDEMRVVLIREILDLGENWLIPKQEPDGGWEEYKWAWPEGSNRNDTARAMQALLWSGVKESDPVIQQGADYVYNALNLSLPGEVDELAQNVWALADAGRGSSEKVRDAGPVFRKMQNWVYEPETWTLCFSGEINQTWLVNITGYDEIGGLMYWEEHNGTFTSGKKGMWEPVWLNFSVFPDTVTLNVTLKTSARWFNMRSLFPPFYELDPWGGNGGPEGGALRINDYEGPGDGINWNKTISEEIDFDRGWGKMKGMPSIAGFTAWGIIGLLQSDAFGAFENESLATGIEWLFDNQSLDGSWYAHAEDGWEWFPYPERCVDQWWIEDTIQNTALPVIALLMNETQGQAVDDAVKWLKEQQAQDGSYPYDINPWTHHINLVSTAHALRAITRAGYTFDSPYIKEAARWLCAAQDENLGGWDEQFNYTRTAAEAMMALAFISYNQSLDLDPGWNLVSISLIQSDTSLLSVLESIQGEYDNIQCYSITDRNDHWKLYSTSKPAHLNDLDEINTKIGFWIHITNPGGTTLRYTGRQLLKNQTITLHPGWNLVGYPSLNPKNRTAALNNIVFGSDVDSIFTYDATAQQWEEVGGLDYFEVGRGYWIHSNVEKVWEVPL